MTSLIHDAGTVVVSLAAVCALLYVASYLRVGWYRSPHGRLMMLLGAGFTAIFTFVAARAIAGTRVEDPWLEAVRFGVYLFGLYVTGRMLWLERHANTEEG